MSSEAQKKLSFEKLVELNNQLDRRLKELRRGQDPPGKITAEHFSWKRFLAKSLFVVVSLVLPFVVLVRTSVYMYSVYNFNGWLALVAGVLATILLLLGYGVFVSYRYENKFRLHKYIVHGIALLVCAYTLYGTMYYSSLNTKTNEIQSYYLSLHPIMRVALTTITLADSDLLVTDIKRNPDDYTRMGLPENQQSLHYLQSDGYVHAVDIRTAGRAEWKNVLTRLAVNLVGLKSIRHEGTADHLHVYLRLNE